MCCYSKYRLFFNTLMSITTLLTTTCHNIPISIYSKTHYFVERETWSSIVHRDFFGVPPTMVDFTTLWERETIIKGGMAATSPQEATKAKYFHREFGDSLHFSWVTTPSYPGVEFINVVAPGVTKGEALKVLTSHLGIILKLIRITTPE